MSLNNFKFYYLFVFLVFGMCAVGCNDDEDNNDDDHNDNMVTVAIASPTNGGTIADCSVVHVHIDVIASVENHQVEVLLYERDTEEEVLDIDMHDHDTMILIERDLDLCNYAAGTCFVLDVLACVNHSCEETSTATAEFCL
jgi:hypothetical protein